MVKLFNVICPDCQGKFHCHWEDLRHKNYELLCPYCGTYFREEDSLAIEE